MVTRIRQLLELRQLSPTQFADLIGVGRPVISHILSGRNKPSLEVVQRIIGAFPELSLAWLLSGAGAMLAGSASGPAPTTTPPLAPAPARRERRVTPTSAPAVALPGPIGVPLAAPEPVAVLLAPPVLLPDNVASPPQVAVVELLASAGSSTPQLAPSPAIAPPVVNQAPSPAAPGPETRAEVTAGPPALAKPGKAIRRIVVLYRDGSFADYLPE